MPSTSKKQHNLMAAVANNPAFAKKAGIPQRVGADFLKADKGRKFAKGGDMAKKFPPFMGKESKAEEAKEMKVKAKSFALYKKGEKAEGVHGKSGKEKPTKYAKGGGCELQGKTKAQRFAGGGMPMMAPPPTAPARPMMASPEPTKYAGPVPTGTGTGSKVLAAPAMAQPSAAQLAAARGGKTSAEYAMGNASKLLAGSQKPSVGVAPAPTVGRPGTRSENWSPQTGYVGADRPKVIPAKPAPKPLPMPTQRKGGFSMSPEAKAKIGDGLSKMRGDVRAKGANEMASKGGTGAQAPNLSMPMPRQQTNYLDVPPQGIKKGGSVKKFASGGSIDGCATKGKTKGRMI